MNIINKDKPEINMCRHCKDRRNRCYEVWNAFFDAMRDSDEYNDEHRQFHDILSMDNIFNHICSDCYWYISQPYIIDKKRLPKISEYPEIKYAENHGLGVAVIPYGYHSDGTIAIIFYIKNPDVFVDAVNDARIKYTHNVPCWKAAITRSLHTKYVHIPSSDVIIRQAIDFLTWKDKKNENTSEHGINIDRTLKPAISRGFVISNYRDHNYSVSNLYYKYCDKHRIPFSMVELKKVYALVSIDFITAGNEFGNQEIREKFFSDVKEYFNSLLDKTPKTKMSIYSIGTFTCINVLREYAFSVMQKVNKLWESSKEEYNGNNIGDKK